MFAILNQVQGYDCSLANAEKLKIVQLPSETQRSVTWVEEFYCACSLFAGRWFSLGFALMETGLNGDRPLVCTRPKSRYFFSFTVSPELFNCSPGVLSDNQPTRHSIHHIKSLLALRKMSAFLILNVYTALLITNLLV